MFTMEGSGAIHHLEEGILGVRRSSASFFGGHGELAVRQMTALTLPFDRRV
jgi:pyruvate/2-oxoglutarate dehydrogenase complex dihydrolipoamide acyltransferase (E2) component